MHTHLAHLPFNVRPGNAPFYRDLVASPGWKTVYDNEGMLGVAGKSDDSLWFIGEVKEIPNDYDGPGMNQLAIGTETQADVDAVADYLTERE